MVHGTKLQIADTGLNVVGGTETYTKVNSGSYVTLPSTTLRSEFTVNTSDNQSVRFDETVTDRLSFHPNNVTSVLPPRFTVSGLLNLTDATDQATYTYLLQMQRSPSIKKMKGGLGSITYMLDNFTDGADKAVYVLIKNFTPNEVLSNGVEHVSFTLQLEQVK